MESTIGSGGFGFVYKATHLLVDRTVAVKVLNHLAPHARERFKREAEAMHRVKHENVVGMHDYGILADGRPYIVMELVAGESLGDLIAREGRMSVEDTINIASEICRALSAAHAANIIHRDLKPGNVLLIRQDSRYLVKVVDFGLAKSIQAEEGESLTVTGETIGTPQYMSPEQCLGTTLDGRSDLYNLGLIMHEMLSGRKVVQHDSMFTCMSMHLNERAPDLPDDAKVPPALAEVVHRTLAKEPGSRYASANEMLKALDTVHQRVTVFVKRKHTNLFKFSALAFLLLLIVVTAVDSLSYHRAQGTKLNLSGLKWTKSTFGRIDYTGPDMPTVYVAGTPEESTPLIRRYSFAREQTIDLKEYQNRDIETEVAVQDKRHKKYEAYISLLPMQKTKVGKENLPGYVNAFMVGPSYEKHVLLTVGPHCYKLKLHSFGRNAQIEAAFERMVGSVVRSQ